MSTPKAFIRTENKKKGQVAIRIRLSDGSKKKDLFYKSNLFVTPQFWDAKHEKLKETADVKEVYTLSERQAFADKVESLKRFVQSVYENATEQEKFDMDSKTLFNLIEKERKPKKQKDSDELERQRKDIFYQFERFFKYKNYPESHLKPYMVIVRLLKRFEEYQKILTRSFKLSTDTLDAETILDIQNFIKEEHLIVDNPKFKRIYELYPEDRKPGERGRNTVIKYMKRLRTFVKWCMNQDIINKDPFAKIQLGTPAFGTPIYITTDERNQIADTDIDAAWNSLSDDEKNEISKHISNHTPARLKEQRDIFIFQCLVGCRVGDLITFTPQNVVSGAIEYIARKTSDNRPITTRVPLSDKALQILSRYYDGKRKNGKLLPFTSEQRYNDDIKAIFYLAGITRNVVTLNQRTGKEEIRPIWEVASSHMARRTFVGNLYKKTGYNKDLVSSMSGHAPNSKAFNRYFKIDEDSKNDAIKLLD